MKPGIYTRVEVSEAQYRAIDAINQSTLKAIAKSPLHYQHALRFGVKETGAMRLGTVAHAAVLEPEIIGRRFAVWVPPPEAKTDNFTGKEFKLFREASEAQGRSVIKQRELDEAYQIAEAIRSHKMAKRYLARGSAEVVLIWIDKATGLLCKARLDWVSLSVPDVMLELKTTGDVAQWVFSGRFAKMQYDVQTAFYSDGYETLTGRPLYAKCAAVESSEPHDVIVYDLAEVVDVGREMYRGYMAKLAECRAASAWPGQAPDAELALTLPKWRDPSDDEDLTGLGLEGMS